MTTEEKDTSTVTSGTTRTNAQETGPHSDNYFIKLLQRTPPTTSHQNSLYVSPLTKDFEGLHRNKTLTSSFGLHRFVLFFGEREEGDMVFVMGEMHNEDPKWNETDIME